MNVLALSAKVVRAVLRGITCLHHRMRRSRGHFHCPDCGLEWDDGAQQ